MISSSPAVFIRHLRSAYVLGIRSLPRTGVSSVVRTKAMAEKVLRTIRDMPYLEVLGFEFRDQKQAMTSGMDLVSSLPRGLTHLKYSVVGWDLKQEPKTAERVVKRIVSPFSHAMACGY